MFMELNVDNLINFFNKQVSHNSDGEMIEQDAAGGGAAAPSSGGGAEGYPTVPKWADVVGGPKRGHANILGKSGEKWVTGMNRGVANQIW